MKRNTLLIMAFPVWCPMVAVFICSLVPHSRANTVSHYAAQIDMEWEYVDFVAQDTERFDEAMRQRPPSLEQPAAIALHLLPSYGVVLSVDVRLDRVENPRFATVTVTDGGILDDDLLGVRHVLKLNRIPARSETSAQEISSMAWTVAGYSKGMLRREHRAKARGGDELEDSDTPRR